MVLQMGRRGEKGAGRGPGEIRRRRWGRYLTSTNRSTTIAWPVGRSTYSRTW